MSPTEIRKLFELEFGSIADKFDYFALDAGDWRNHKLLDAARPRVYVWYDGCQERVVKVGCSLVNARARALEHLRDNTGDTMSEFAHRSDVTMILFSSSTVGMCHLGPQLA
jgi:recombinational DNA repair ATPase RecF